MARYTPEDRARVLTIYRDVIRPVHAGLFEHYGIPDSPGADAMSIAPLWQESKGAARDQGDDGILGPACGFWQFERNGGVAEILEDRRTAEVARALCAAVGVRPERDPVWRLFFTQAGDDLAAAFARLLVWKDPRALPPVTPAGQTAAYRLYDDNWRPGAKRPNDWPDSWALALDLVAEVRGLSTQGEGTAAIPPLANVGAPRAAAPPPAPRAADAGLEARVAALEGWAARVRAAVNA